MSVSTKHPQYVSMEYSWMALRDAYTGSAAVKGAMDYRYGSDRGRYAGTAYLPVPTGMNAEQYGAYRDRASWLGATEHAVHGLSGAAFRRDPVVTVPAVLEPQLLDITQTGMPLRAFAEHVVAETLLMGRYGVLLDFPPEGEDLSGVMEVPGVIPAPLVDPRPYWIGYQAEEIYNWRTRYWAGKTILTLVVLRECVPVVHAVWPSDDFFKVEEQTQYRVLRLDEAGEYEVSLWWEAPQRHAIAPPPVLIRAWKPRREDRPLTAIPFRFFGPGSLIRFYGQGNLEPSVQKSLMEPVVEKNYLNYRHSADKEHGLHMLIPTAYVCSNSEPPAEPLTRGATIAWWIADNQAKVGELKGPDSLAEHDKAMAEDKQDMALFTARLLESTPLVPETATQVRVRTAGSDSPMQGLLRTVSEGLTQTLQLHAWWNGSVERVDDPSISVVLNSDLLASTMDPQTLTALTSALLQHTISYETYWYNLQQGEIARPLVTAEEEQELIDLRREQQALAFPPLVVRPGQGPPVPAGQNGRAG